jgi:hypothetical protein
MDRFQRLQIRFQRQPPGTAITRSLLIGGGVLAAVAAWLVVARLPRWGALAAGLAGVLLLVGGHRANHGAGGPTDRMLDELLDRTWDGAVFGSIAWVSVGPAPHVAVGALVALSASYLSAYVRARGASLAYSVEESHVTRGIRYGFVVAGLGLGGVWLAWGVWLAAALSILAALVRTTQVTREERA